MGMGVVEKKIPALIDVHERPIEMPIDEKKIFAITTYAIKRSLNNIHKQIK